ncbi:hypothetical protein B7P43_G05945 [Cryptotermes secundus]|uniref:Mariner Mos1 transposase n=1 Tax=Cryptotermes secundus TaxID=105785 RepID=A0A2J7PUK9_9NEOP|nr:hypothetical protein B7P43_G05945 [Cryptotermes secundus]
MNSKNKNIRDLYRRITDFKRGYQPSSNLVKDENGDLLADSNSILNRWRNYFSQSLNVHRVSAVRQTEIHTDEPLIPDPNPFEFESAIANLKLVKSLGSDQDSFPSIIRMIKSYQPSSNLVKDENGDLLADSHNILNRWMNYFSQLLNVHRVSDVRQTEIHTDESLVPDSSPFEFQSAIRRLTDENKQRRLECCEQLLQRYRDEGDDFLLNIVTGDESWVHRYDLEEKRQIAEYRHPSSPQAKNFKTQPSVKKLLLTVFWDAHRVYVTDFLKRGTTVNSFQYIQTLKHLRRRVCPVRGSLAPIILQHDNARPHTSRATEEALRNLKFEPIPQPPYSPDLAPCDFYFFFPLLKRDLKGNHYTSDDEVKAAVKSWIREKSEEFFSDGMKNLVTRWEKCVSLNGDYVEK